MNSDISALGLRPATDPNAVRGVGKNTLDQTDFLALMTAQLRNQDPTKPIDNSEYVSQLAQFSTVTGISQTNSALAQTNDGVAATNKALAAILTKLDALATPKPA